MLIVAKQAFECINPSTGDKFVCRNHDIVTPPDWVAADAYFKALCDDGLVTCHIDSKAVEASVKAESDAPKADTAKRGRKSES